MRVRVERAQQPADGAVDELIGLRLADVLILDGAQRRGKDQILLGDTVLRTQRLASEERGGKKADRNEDGYRRGTDSTHGHPQNEMRDFRRSLAGPLLVRA